MSWATHVLQWRWQQVTPSLKGMSNILWIIIIIFDHEQGIPSKRESSACVDYIPALCTHCPSLLPVEWFSEASGLALLDLRDSDGGQEVGQTWSFRGSKSRNKVSIGEPAERSSPIFIQKEVWELPHCLLCEPLWDHGSWSLAFIKWVDVSCIVWPPICFCFDFVGMSKIRRQLLTVDL